MKKTITLMKNGVSYQILLKLEGVEIKAVDYQLPDFCFPTLSGEGLGVISEVGYRGAAIQNGNHVPGGKFVKHIWRGFIYPNGREDIPDIETASNEILRIAEKTLAPAIAFQKACEIFINNNI